MVRRARLINSSIESRKIEIMFASGAVVMMIGGAAGYDTSNCGVGAELGEDCAVEMCRRQDPLGRGGFDEWRIRDINNNQAILDSGVFLVEGWVN